MKRTPIVLLLINLTILGCTHYTKQHSGADSTAGASSSAADNKEAAISMYDAMNIKDFAKLDQYFTTEFTDHDPSERQGPGLAGLKQSLEELKTEFPDFHFAIEETVAEGDLVAVRYRLTGTNTGRGPDAAPTNKNIDVNGFDLLRFKYGKATEHWGLADNMKMMQQLGYIGNDPAPHSEK